MCSFSSPREKCAVDVKAYVTEILWRIVTEAAYQCIHAESQTLALQNLSGNRLSQYSFVYSFILAYIYTYLYLISQTIYSEITISVIMCGTVDIISFSEKWKAMILLHSILEIGFFRVICTNKITWYIGEERTNRWHKYRCLFTTG